MMTEKVEKNTTIARDKEGNFININNDNVLSGAHDYFCVGCKAQMIAHLPKCQIKRYFRHDPKFINLHQEVCNWSDEKTIHKLAKDILQIEKKIAVPRLLKFPPNGETNVYKIRDSEIIVASHVENEMDFFEDINGKLNFKRLSIAEKSLVESHIIPDVTFFNSENKPILFIEIVVTSGIKENKWIKIKRLGIDTIQVKIPTDSLESINEYFKNNRTNHTKWIYNNEEQNTSYFSFSPSSGKRVSTIDDFEGSIFEENFKCRKSQIGGLIRRIGQILEQEHYTEIIGGIEYEILRADEDTERNIERLRKIQNNVRTRIEGKYSEQNSELTRGETGFRSEKGRVENLNQEEQITIRRKKASFDKATGEIEHRITEYRELIVEQDKEIERLETEIRKSETDFLTFNEQTRGVEGELIDVSRRIQQFRERINEIKSKETGIINEFNRSVKAIPAKYLEIGRKLEEDSRRRRREIISDFERRKEAIRQDFEFRRTKMQREFDENSKRIIEGVRRRDSKAVPELGGRINGCNNINSALIDIGKVKANGRRLHIVKKCFESKSWKNWDKFREVYGGNG